MSKIIYPLTAPELPVPGLEFLATAANRGDDSTTISGKGRKSRVEYASPILEELIEECLYGGGSAEVTYKLGPGKSATVRVISGHLFGRSGPSAGPEPADVMIIGKMLGTLEKRYKRSMVGPTYEFFSQALMDAGVPKEELEQWYMTNVLKSIEPELGKWKMSWVNGSAHLLQQELRLVRPKFILCLGTMALKSLFGHRATLSKCEGQVMDYEFCISKEDSDELEYHKCKVMGVLHPRGVMKEPELMDRYLMALNRFYRLTKGDVKSGSETVVDHRVIDNEADLEALIKEINETCHDKIVAVDAEWHGEHPQNAGSYLRCIQLSWADKKAACIVLHHEGGKPAFKRRLTMHDETVETVQGGLQVAISLLKDVLKDKRVVGHYFTADLEWLVHYGLDLREQYKPAASPELCKTEGGLDTALMAHAINEVDDFSLNGQIFRYLDINRYDTDLIKWKEDYCRENGLKASDLEGYGDCPGEILYPYANFDADTTRRLAIILMDKLDNDRYGNNCWKPFWITHSASLPILEMKRTGLLIDKDRLDELTVLYMNAEQKWGRKIREWARWEKLNMNSVFHVRELLFGTKYNGRKDANGKPIRQRPMEARSVNAVPVLSSEKRPRPWEEVVRDGAVDEVTASTNKQAIGIMYHNAKLTKIRVPDGRGNWVVAHADCSEIISAVRNYKIVSHVFKSLLDKPKLDVAHDCYELDEDENWVYDKGIAKYICSDGRVRTTIYPTKETGRWSSAKPPMQNWSKKREADYGQILGDDYKYPLRSMIVADPGHVLIEADYIGAELFIMAVLSGDQTMLDHVRRNQLSEDDPDYHDIHSSIAKLAFNLPCEPTKAGLASIGKKHLRIVAKAVAFGVAYGRQAKAIAVAVQEEGINITEEEAQAIIRAIFTMYPSLEVFFKECRDRVNLLNSTPNKSAPGWLANSFGRYRRFSVPEDKKIQGEIERQSMNYPLQSTVADAVSLATKNLYEYREANKGKIDYRLVLQVHDAIMLLVPIEHVEQVLTEVIPQCMISKVPIYRTNLDGKVISKDPYFLGVDTSIYTSWGVTMFPDELMKNGISPELDGWHRVGPGWSHSDFGTDVWVDGKFYKPEELELFI